MKKAILLATGLLFTATAVFAAPFAPTLLKLSAPSQVLYQFDNSTLSIPVTVAGKPATTLFCVYTSGKTAAISAVQNGYLGWHYVNKVDTSLFISQAVELPVGSNAIDLFCRLDIRVWPQVETAIVGNRTGQEYPGSIFFCNFYIWIALVVFQTDIELRFLGTRKVGLGDQGLNFGVGDNEIQVSRLTHEPGNLRTAVAFLPEIGKHP